MPDAHECLVDLEHIRKVLGALRSELVAANTENNGNLASMASMGFMASMASMGADVVNHSQLLAEGTNGELQANGVAYLTLVSAVFTLSMPAKSLAASHPKSLLLTLQTQFSVFRVRGC